MYPVVGLLCLHSVPLFSCRSPECTRKYIKIFITVNSSYSHIKYFQEKCDCKRSVTLSRVAQNSEFDYRKVYKGSFALAQKLFPSTFSMRNVLKSAYIQ